MNPGRVIAARRDELLVPHDSPLLEGRLLARYDRFIAEVRLGRRTVEAHCVNPGQMEGLVIAGARVWLSAVDPASKRKTRYTLELIEDAGSIVGINTNAPNRIAAALVAARLVPGLRRFRTLRREVRYGQRSRVDLLLEGSGRRHFVEVKNVHLRYPDGRAYFPDSVSARAMGHLRVLAEQVALGDRATVLFVVQRPDVTAVRPSWLHDPEFARTAREVAAAGVRFRAVALDVSPAGYRLAAVVPVHTGRWPLAQAATWREQLRGRSGWIRRGRRALAV